MMYSDRCIFRKLFSHNLSVWTLMVAPGLTVAKCYVRCFLSLALDFDNKNVSLQGILAQMWFPSYGHFCFPQASLLSPDTQADH